MSTDHRPEEVDHLFLLKNATSIHAVLWLLAGIASIGFAMLGFIIALVGGVGQFAMHAITTLPLLMGVGALTAAWNLFYAPIQVAIGSSGVTVEGQRGQVTHAWDSIGWATIETGGMNHQRRLAIYDTQGKRLAQISEAFDNFETIVELVTSRVQSRSDNTSENIRSKKSKQTALLSIVVGSVMLFAGVAIAWMTHREARAAQLLTNASIPGEAEILRHFLAPNGVTARLEYKITNEAGISGTRNAELVRGYWDSLKDATSVAIVYVPDEPWISRLVEGEVEETDFTRTPLGGYGLSAAAMAMGLLFLGLSVLQWRGWDIDLDSKTRKFSIKKFGTGR